MKTSSSRDYDDPPGTRYKVWVVIEREDGKTGKNEELDSPGSFMHSFETYEEAVELAEVIQYQFGSPIQDEEDSDEEAGDDKF